MNKHISVLPKLVAKHLKLVSNSIVVDCTLGGGGHTLELITTALDQKISNLTILAIDLDPLANTRLLHRIESEQIAHTVEGNRIMFGVDNMIIFRQGNFTQTSEFLAELSRENKHKVKSAILDLGPSQNQIEDNAIGLSYKKDAPLDMRIDPKLEATAADLLNFLPKAHIVKMFREYGDIKYALQLAEVIVDSRRIEPIRTTKDFINLVNSLTAKRRITIDAKELAKCFQSLRIATNLEFTNLRNVLEQLSATVTDKILVITFHSGEEKVLVGFAKEQKISYQVYIPDFQSTKSNPRSRSAKAYLLNLR